jgi:hypothetical protein
MNDEMNMEAIKGLKDYPVMKWFVAKKQTGTETTPERG